jgi:uncharacterized membrane protein
LHTRGNITLGRMPSIVNLILTLVGLVLLILGVFALIGGNLVYGLILIVVGLVLASYSGRTYYGGRSRI